MGVGVGVWFCWPFTGLVITNIKAGLECWERFPRRVTPSHPYPSHHRCGLGGWDTPIRVTPAVLGDVHLVSREAMRPWSLLIPHMCPESLSCCLTLLGLWSLDRDWGHIIESVCRTGTTASHIWYDTLWLHCAYYTVSFCYTVHIKHTALKLM